MPRDGPTSQRASGKVSEVGWEAGIRTPITWSRGDADDVGGFGLSRFCLGKSRESLGRLRLEAAFSCAICQVFVKSCDPRFTAERPTTLVSPSREYAEHDHCSVEGI